MSDTNTTDTYSKAVLCSADKNTILAALAFYLEKGQGEPDMRPPEIQAVATGELDDLDECISLDTEEVAELIRNIKSTDGVEFR